ncbi:unnamed protein product [Paramecium primaurelia]|uniref:Ethanolaminephosphotransferase n=2 Tax=Paramecium primaurelia TaxID=5886 RepID=A0A8S1P2V8_PARPR|nr:unnamed protein product [Paramecium primaurelia]
MKYLNYDFIAPNHLHYLKSYRYKGTDQSLLYNYILSPLAEFCLRFVPMNVAPNVLTLMGLACIILPHILFFFVMGDNFAGFIPNWLLWLTALLHMLYMNFDNLDGKQARRTKNSSPLGMILDHNFDSMIILLQGTSMTTAMQFGNTIFSVILYIIPSVPFYIIAHEEYYTHEMNLPIINAAAEGTISVAVVFAATAYYGCDMWLQKLPWFFNYQINQFVMLMFIISVIITMPAVFLKIKKFTSIASLLKQLRYFFFFNTVILYSILFTQTNVIQDHVRAYMYTVGFTMSKAVGVVALNHVSNQNLPEYLNSIYIYIIILLNTISGQIFGKTIIDEGCLIQFAAIISFLIHIHFLYNMARQISEALNIKIFQINSTNK